MMHCRKQLRREEKGGKLKAPRFFGKIQENSRKTRQPGVKKFINRPAYPKR